MSWAFAGVTSKKDKGAIGFLRDSIHLVDFQDNLLLIGALQCYVTVLQYWSDFLLLQFRAYG